MKSDSIKVNAKRKNKRVCTRYEINGQTLTAKKVGKRAKYMDGFVYRYERWIFVWCIFWNSFFLFLCCHCWSEAICGHWRYWISERALLWTLDTHAHTCVFPRCCWVDSRLLYSCDIHASTTYTESVANMVTSCHITKYVSHDMAIWLWCVFVCVNCLHNQTSKITRTHYKS